MNQKLIQSETSGVLLVLSSAVLWGVFPILINHGVKIIPPLTFAAISTLIAAAGALMYTIQQKTLREFKYKKAYFPLFMITMCFIVVPFILLFIGTQKTSALNTTLLDLTEIIFTIIFTHFIGEKTTLQKLIGALGIFFGAFFIMYNGQRTLNFGDILIILSTVLYPVGNFYGKKALKLISPATILFIRTLIGGLILSVIALFFEREANWQLIFIQHWKLFLLNGLLLLGLSKVLWYESLKRLDISKAVSLIMTFPISSLIILIILGEKISLLQSIGIGIMFIGVIFSVLRKSVKSV